MKITTEAYDDGKCIIRNLWQDNPVQLVWKTGSNASSRAQHQLKRFQEYALIFLSQSFFKNKRSHTIKRMMSLYTFDVVG